MGDPAAWIAATGIQPMSLAGILAARPATSQDRWYAGLYFLKPTAIACLAALFIGTGIVCLGPGWQEGLDVLAPSGLPYWAAATVIGGGAVLDLVLGVALLVRRTTRLTLIAMVGLTVIYLIGATVLNPGLWADPLGRLLKTIPAMALMLVALAVLDER
jgi:hypothetical protein